MKNYRKLFETHLTTLVGLYRKKLQYTQEQMAEVLQISPRAYYDIKRKKNSISASVLIFLLLLMSDEELLAFHDNMKEIVAQAEQEGDLAV